MAQWIEILLSKPIGRVQTQHSQNAFQSLILGIMWKVDKWSLAQWVAMIKHLNVVTES